MTAPSIVLEDGAYFKGKITMTDKPVIAIKTVNDADKTAKDSKESKAVKTA
ncbi:hypothetical protein MNB_SUP05-6-287 [hydrothermal vent metagenome]|uniref:Uncharacterized protein n=1 Tax=hydrothermal vent metagenome TaxID=652676 RepID=A0A1W1DJN2_9ZZZZ